MTKQELCSKGIHADAALGNHYYICDCGNEWRDNLRKPTCPRCGKGNAEFHYIADLAAPPTQTTLEICTDDAALLQARTEARAKPVSPIHRHVFQCHTCKAIHEQTDYYTAIPCRCGDTMAIRYTVAKGIEYYGNGYPVGKQVMRKDILKAVRKRLGITQKKLADDIGVTQQYLSSIERNDKPIPTMILRWIYDHI